MRTQSAKAKGRRLQQWWRDVILGAFPSLEEDDVKSTSMGASGEDVTLSPAARKLLPISTECKSKKSHAVYSLYDQAIANSKGYEPVLVIKADRKKPLVVVDAMHYIDMWVQINKVNQ